MKTITSILVFLLSGLTTIQAENIFADSLVTFTGTVIDKYSGEPISAAKVLYKKVPYESETGILTTNNKGQFTAYFRYNEKYTLLIEQEGYFKIADIVEANKSEPNLTLSLTFEMRIGGAGQVLTLNDLQFEQGRSIINEESYKELDNLVVMLNDSKSMVIQLEGHTDYRGSPSANMELSQLRVEAIKTYLVSKEISESRIKTKAFGGTLPLTRDDSAEARAQNRRVEVRILSD